LPMSPSGFTGVGFVSINIALLILSSFRCRRCLFHVARVEGVYHRGDFFRHDVRCYRDDPVPPQAIMGNVMKSSPDRTPILSPHKARISDACWREPVASFDKQRYWGSGQPATVSGNMLTLVRPGTL
jgi:hypothetical protein